MLTALSLAFLLGQPASSCPNCGGQQGPGCFPITCHEMLDRAWNFCHGDILGLQRTKCVAPLGSFAPGGDDWAFRMHGGAMPVSAPVNVPVAAPAPPPPVAPRVNSDSMSGPLPRTDPSGGQGAPAPLP
jgi:hypothetical protein